MARRAKLDPTLEQIHAYALEVCGDRGLKVAQTVGEGATDEKIEKKTKFKVAEIRAVLNQLHEHGIVEYTREKNLENGWFTYTWRINPDRAMRNFLSAKKNQHQRLMRQMAGEEAKLFYSCRKKCMRVAFDDAMESNFRCPECRGKLRFASNDNELKALKQKISALEQILIPTNNGLQAPDA